MSLHFRCPHCKIGSHRSRAVHMDRKEFEDQTREIAPHTELCPITRQPVTYSREEMFWQSDAQ